MPALKLTFTAYMLLSQDRYLHACMLYKNITGAGSQYFGCHTMLTMGLDLQVISYTLSGEVSQAMSGQNKNATLNGLQELPRHAMTMFTL